MKKNSPKKRRKSNKKKRSLKKFLYDGMKRKFEEIGSSSTPTSLLSVIEDIDFEDLEDSQNIENLIRETKIGDFNARDANGRTAIMIATWKYFIRIVICLLKYEQIDVNIQDNEGKTLLMYLVLRGLPIKEDEGLLASLKRTNINLRDREGKTALIYSAEKGRIDYHRLLIEAGANVNIQDNLGKTALMYTDSSSCLDDYSLAVANERMGDIDINIQDNEGKTALMYIMSQYFYRDIFELDNFIREAGREGLNMNIQDNKGKTALMYANGFGEEKIIILLSDVRTNVNLQDNEGKTALMYSVHNFSVNSFSLAIANEREGGGLDMNIRDHAGRTALMYIVQLHYYTPLISLITLSNLIIGAGGEGLNVNIQDNEGKTALMYAVVNDLSLAPSHRNHNPNLIVEKMRLLLLFNEIELNARDNEGKTIFEYMERIHSLIEKFPEIKERLNYLRTLEMTIHASDSNRPLSILRTRGDHDRSVREQPLGNFSTEVIDSPHILSMALGFLNPSLPTPPSDGRKKKKSRKKKKRRSP